ncbi:transposase [Chloroflexus sp.]|uniref:transposase n=1 Tax=Chloroflexus sp. TaxID=1904827 RepID=UPI002633387D|nr:transposase [uncultured Chloroflexus sp.]
MSALRVQSLPSRCPQPGGMAAWVLQRRVARRTTGSARRGKAVLRLQRPRERIANTRTDFLNNLAHRLIARDDRIALDDLRITTMARNRHLATR